MAPRWTGKAVRELALEVRGEFGLSTSDVLCPYRVAEEYGVPVYSLDDLAGFGCPPEALRHFAGGGREAWSAALVPNGVGRIIVENPAHSRRRRRSNVAHELGHLLLEHEIEGPLFTRGGCRRVDSAMRTMEREATAFCGEVLLPTKAAVGAAFAGKSDAEVARVFDVSVAFARWRMNVSGARIIARRAAGKRIAERSATRGEAPSAALPASPAIAYGAAMNR